MDKLNLPSYDHKIKQEGGKVFIFDEIRKKYIVLTPEEWVRQHFIQYMITKLGYPRGLIKVEGGVKYNGLNKRSDLVAFDRDSEPLLLVECKAPEVYLNQSTFEQAAMYNRTIGARFVVLTNGIEHSCFTYNPETKSIEFLDHLPSFDT